MAITMDNDPTIVVSMADIVQHPYYEKLLIEYSEENSGEIHYEDEFLTRMLREMGLDTERRYDVSICLHVAPLSLVQSTCERFYGMERTDKDWVGFKEAMDAYYLGRELDGRFQGRFSK